MRVLLVYAHPVETSFNAALKDRIVASLSERHEVDVLDLNAEGFNPVMSRAERLGYHDIPGNIAPVADQVARLRAAQAMVLCFPAWSFGPPAILKGWIDRVMLPGVSLHIQPDWRTPAAATAGRTARSFWTWQACPRTRRTRSPLSKRMAVSGPAGRPPSEFA